MLDQQDVPLTSPTMDTTSHTMEMVVQVEKGDKKNLRRANRALALTWALCLALGNFKNYGKSIAEEC